MNHSRKIILLLALLSINGAVSFAQTTGLTPPPKRNFKYDGKIVTTYDQLVNETMVLIQMMPVLDVEDPTPILESSADKPRSQDRLGFTMFFTYPGKNLVTPKFVSIGFNYMALDPQRYESHLLSAKIDGERVSLGTMKVLGRKQVVVRYAYKPYTSELLELVIPYEQLLKMANAKKVKLKLGDFGFDLSKDHLEAVRDLASRTVP